MEREWRDLLSAEYGDDIKRALNGKWGIGLVGLRIKYLGRKLEATTTMEIGEALRVLRERTKPEIE